MNYLFYFIGLIFIKIRLKLHKEHAKRWRERFVTINQHFNNNNETIWVHAVSLGEVKSAINMIKKFSNDGFNIILTTNTVISAEFIDTIVIQNMIHQFFPIPYNSNILKFLI